MRREDLLYSIGEIDEKFVSEAERPYFGLMPKIMKYGSIAASFLLVMTVSFFLIFQVFFGVMGEDGMGGDADYSDGADGGSGNMSGGSGSTGSTNSPAESDTLFTDGARLTLLSYDSEKIELLLEIGSEISTPEVRILLSKSGEEFVMTTEENYGGSQIPLGLPDITVDGDESTELPSSAGEYLITLDLSSVKNEGYELCSVLVLPFGKINLIS